ncbi:MAG: hypothetical protein ACTSRP_15710 [Candidatus Helarchaeota archaeon]
MPHRCGRVYGCNHATAQHKPSPSPPTANFAENARKNNYELRKIIGEMSLEGSRV